MSTGIALTIILGMLPSAVNRAQEDRPSPNTEAPQSFREIAPDLPDDADWAIRLQEDGGYLGSRRSLSADSTGSLECIGFPDACHLRLDAAALEALDQAISAATPEAWSTPAADEPLTRVANDLLLISLTLTVRQGEDPRVVARTAWRIAPAEGSAEAAGIRRLLLELSFPR